MLQRSRRIPYDVCQTTARGLPGKENPVEVTNITCHVCPVCNAKVIDGVTFDVVKKTAKKIKDPTLDFSKVHGIAFITGKP